jgi:chemotaxis protein methyltransferase CheR
MERVTMEPCGNPSIDRHEGVAFLQWALPQMGFRWPGFRKVRRQVLRRIGRRMAELGLPGLDAYRSYLEQHADEWAVLDSFCRISISRFYRDRDVFDCLAGSVFPEAARRARARGRSELRCWSAGGASGEEPCTLAVIWQLSVEPDFPGMSLRIVATEVESQMIQRAREAVYPSSSLKDLPASWRECAFEQVGKEYRLKRRYRDNVQWLQQDVRQEAPGGLFDLILCRHLTFTYFDDAVQRHVVARFTESLEPEGYLVTAKKEKLPNDLPNLEAAYPKLGIYRKRHAARIQE